MLMLVRLAWRSLWRHTRRTVLTIFAISMGLALGLFFIALGEGQYDRLIADAVRIQAGHVTVEHPEYLDAPAAELYVPNASAIAEKLKNLPEVDTIRPMVLASGFATTAHGGQGVLIFGVDPAIESQMSPLADAEHLEGRYLENDHEPMAIIGKSLAEQLELELGMKLVLTTSAIPTDDPNEGTIVPTLVRVAGIYESGSEEIDGRIVQIPIRVARSLMRMPDDSVHRLGVILRHNHAVDATAARAVELVDGAKGIRVRPWPEVMPELWSFMQVDQGGNWVMQGILMGLILFIIFNTIYMSVMERQREFAVLAALGTPPGRIRAQVIVESFLIGLVSALVGLAIGYATCEYFRVHGLDLSEMMEEVTVSGFFMDPVMRPVASFSLMLRLGVTVLVATVIMGLLPARRATRIDIVDTLRSGA